MALPDIDGWACSAIVMFERTPPSIRTGGSDPQNRAHDDSLRELSWSDLVARLTAERDLRRQLNAQTGVQVDGATASFDVESASTLVQSHGEAEWNYERGVNHKISAYRKSTKGRRDADDTGRGDDARDRLHDPRT